MNYPRRLEEYIRWMHEDKCYGCKHNKKHRQITGKCRQCAVAYRDWINYKSQWVFNQKILTAIKKGR